MIKKKFGKTRILSFVLSLALLVGLIPTTAFAATTEELWVNGVNIMVDDDKTVECGEGTAVYDEATATLTLTNATITSGNLNFCAIDIPNTINLTINLVGANIINYSGASIYSATDIIFSGTGNLAIMSGNGQGISSLGSVTVDGATLNVSCQNDGAIAAENNFTLRNGANVTAYGLYYGIQVWNENLLITGQSKLDAKSTEANCNAVYVAHGNATIEDDSSFIGESRYPALFSLLDMIIADSMVNAVSTDDGGLASQKDIVISGNSTVTAQGYYSAISTVNLVINNGKVNATSTNDMGIWARGSIAINGGEVYSKGGVDGEDKLAAIGVRYQKQADDTDPVSKITVNSNYAEINGGKVSVSDWDNKDRSWTSFIAKDEDKLSQGRLNALNEITIKIKSANYTVVDEAIATANALNKDNYKNFSAVTNAINAVVRDLDITKQTEVTAMAKAIEDAINALELKGANYIKVDEAIEKANALNKDNYKDFSAVTAAINAVVRDKDITEQETVNAMAKAIEDAIKGLELKPITPPVSKPEIIDGANQIIEQGKEASFKSNADIKDFQKILLDGKEISSNNYTLTEGSTIVTLKDEFVKTLSVGKHTLSIVSTTGSADTEFTITKSTISKPDTDSPQTGDNSNMVLWIAVLFVSAGGILTLTLKRKKSVQ